MKIFTLTPDMLMRFINIKDKKNSKSSMKKANNLQKKKSNWHKVSKENTVYIQE